MKTKDIKKLKVVFFGTSDRSVPLLNALNNNFKLKLCVTKTDRVVGRNQDKEESAVKKWAKENKVQVLSIENLKGDNLEKVLTKLKSLNPDLGIVADFSLIIPFAITDSLGDKLINIHFSLLPKYRGACPVQFAILNGDDTTGVTFHIINEKMDAGDIIFQIVYKMHGFETSGQLYDTLFEITAGKLPEIIEKYISGQITPLSQNKEEATYTYSPSHPQSTFIYKEDALIDWGKKPLEIEQMIRAFNPWPIAWTTLGDLERAKILNEKIKLKEFVSKDVKVKIYKAEVIENKLGILELQIEGKNKTTWKDFKNGYSKL